MFFIDLVKEIFVILYKCYEMSRLQKYVKLLSLLVYLPFFTVICSSCKKDFTLDTSIQQTDSTLITNIISKAENYTESLPDSAKILLDDALEQLYALQKSTNKESDSYFWVNQQIVLAHRALGVYFTNIGELKKGLDEIEMSLTFVENYKESNTNEYFENKIAILNSKGVVLKKLGLFDEALATYHVAQTLAKQNNDSASVAIFYTNTGNIYQEIGDNKKAKEYISEAIKLHEQLENERGVAISSLTLANILNSQAQFHEARPYYIKALNFCEKKSYVGHVGLIQSNLGVLEKRLGNFGKAKEYFSNAETNLQKADNKHGLSLVYGNLADLAYDLGDYKQTIVYALKQLEGAKQMDALVNQRYAYRHLSKAYKSMGNYKDALENHLLFTQLNDSILSIEKQNEISRLEAVFQDEKKQEEIQYLANLSSILEKQNRTKGIMLTLLTLLLITIVMLGATWLRNSKLKANRKQLALEHKLLRSQMNPHFLFNSLSTIQNMVLRAGKMEAAGLVTSFAKFIRFILESSRSNLVPLDKEIEAITLYLNLQKVRFPNLFEHTIRLDVKEDPSEILVPPLIIQPFVENSVIHGFPKDRNDGKLDIHFFQTNGTICCKIKDNGVGFATAKSPKEGTHKSVATQIVRERLELLSKRHKAKASLTYEDDIETGTSVLITLPLLFYDDDDLKNNKLSK